MPDSNRHSDSRRERDASPTKNGKRSFNEEEEAPDALPQPYDATELQPAKRRAVSPSQQPRKQKRPSARARISESQQESIRRRQQERDRESAMLAAEADRHRAQHGVNDVVRHHYNSVPERGREWRTRDSRIKGLRMFNNWIKSCIIQRYSPDEDHTPGSREMGRSSGKDLLVLDIGCGKGGDLNKWQQAPQPVELYVGLDPADVSIDQARDRYRSLGSRGGGGRGGRGGFHNRRPPPRVFEGRFFVKDCYNSTIEDLDIIRQVGFDPSPMNKRGFDVVSMMFSMHYAFENEQTARTMLRNVAGALKKGGRFIGCIPNSDVLSERVRKFNEKHGAKGKDKSGAEGQDTAANGNDTSGEVGDNEFAVTPASTPPHFAPSPPADDGEVADADNPTAPIPAQALTEPPSGPPASAAAEPEEGELEEGEEEPTAEWGNSIYRVRFPGPTPHDGIFRPAFGWKYSFFLDEAVEEVPEYVVPWEAFRALADDFNLELQFHRTFREIWEAEKDDPELGPLSERMGVRQRGGGPLLVSEEEMEAASFYIGFCFYKV